MRAKRALLLLSSLLLLSGCDVTLGPKTEDHVVFIRTTNPAGQPVVAGRVAENKSVLVEYETDKKKFKQKLDIGGWFVVPPTDPVKP